MKVLAFTGYSGAGKTTLLEQVIAELAAQGQRVAVIKHAHHRFDMDHPGKDSFRHREAGAAEVLIASRQRTALLREFRSPVEPAIADLMQQLDPASDWVLVEGFRGSHLPKLEVWRPLVRGQPHYADDACVVALATDAPDQLPTPPAVPVFDLNLPAVVVQWMLAQAHRWVWLNGRVQDTRL